MFRAAVAAIVVCFIVCGTSLATLCDKCKDKMYIMSVGHCKFCTGNTPSGAFKICPKCSGAKGLCEHCGVALAGAKTPDTPDKPKDTTQPTTDQSAPAAGATDPQGLPVEAKLVTEKDTYTLDAKQSGDEFAKKLRESESGREAPPEPPAVSMTFKLTNTGKETITIPVGADGSSHV